MTIEAEPRENNSESPIIIAWKNTKDKTGGYAKITKEDYYSVFRLIKKM